MKKAGFIATAVMFAAVALYCLSYDIASGFISACIAGVCLACANDEGANKFHDDDE